MPRQTCVPPICHLNSRYVISLKDTTAPLLRLANWNPLFLKCRHQRELAKRWATSLRRYQSQPCPYTSRWRSNQDGRPNGSNPGIAGDCYGDCSTIRSSLLQCRRNPYFNIYNLPPAPRPVLLEHVGLRNGNPHPRYLGIPSLLRTRPEFPHVRLDLHRVVCNGNGPIGGPILSTSPRVYSLRVFSLRAMDDHNQRLHPSHSYYGSVSWKQSRPRQLRYTIQYIRTGSIDWILASRDYHKWSIYMGDGNWTSACFTH